MGAGAMMRQIAFAGAGGPEVLRLVEAPRPNADAGMVVVRVPTAGVNRPDSGNAAACIRHRPAPRRSPASTSRA